MVAMDFFKLPLGTTLLHFFFWGGGVVGFGNFHKKVYSISFGVEFFYLHVLLTVELLSIQYVEAPHVGHNFSVSKK